eukprot:gene6021-12134_t
MLLFVVLSFFLLRPWGISSSQDTDPLNRFYNLLSSVNSKKCPDPTFLMPDCKTCIPGLLRKKGESSCSRLSPVANKLRVKIEALTTERFGKAIDPSRKYGLYPYLETDEFLYRQRSFGALLAAKNATHILDIGSYYNPINLFLGNHCPQSVVIVEPILDAVSALVPCGSGATKAFTHIIILPIPFSSYSRTKGSLPQPDAVVCIGCDSVFGPSRKMLESSFERPYTLYMEYPEEYVHDAVFNLMQGTGTGEKLTLMHRFTIRSNQTQYTKRCMKVITYSTP